MKEEGGQGRREGVCVREKQIERKYRGRERKRWRGKGPTRRREGWTEERQKAESNKQLDGRKQYCRTREHLAGAAALDTAGLIAAAAVAAGRLNERKRDRQTERKSERKRKKERVSE